MPAGPGHAEHVDGVGGEGIGDPRVKGAAAPAADDAGRELRTTEQMLEHGVASHMNDPDRQRDLLAAQPCGLALAVPPLEKMQRTDR